MTALTSNLTGAHRLKSEPPSELTPTQYSPSTYMNDCLPSEGCAQDTIEGDDMVTTRVVDSKECAIFGQEAEHGQGIGEI